MSKSNKLKYLLIIISIILVFTGVTILEAIKSNDNLEENTVIEINGETGKTLKANIKGFYPGKTFDYAISLVGDGVEEYLITLKFSGDNGGALKNYLDVKIVTDNGSIEKPLNELLEGELITLGRGVSQITISYTMPIDTGNESQGTSVVFYVELNAKMVE